MFGVSFNILLTFNVFFIVLSSLYLIDFFCILSYNKHSYWFLKKTLLSFTILVPREIHYYINAQLFMLLTFRVHASVWTQAFLLHMLYAVTILILFKLLLRLSKTAEVSKNLVNDIFMALMFIFLAYASIYFVSDLIFFFFLLEVIGVSYYFFFLAQLSQTALTFLKFKNLLSMYLWTSFLVMLLLALAMLLLSYKVGTLDFLQLNWVSTAFPSTCWYFLIAAMCWKVGAPGFHFFKLQLYQFLPLYTVLIFSCVTLLINYFLLQFILASFTSFFFINRATVLIYLLLFNIVLLFKVQKNAIFYEFLGYSAINTWALIFLFGLL